jgi:hypothetical protein
LGKDLTSSSIQRVLRKMSGKDFAMLQQFDSEFYVR